MLHTWVMNDKAKALLERIVKLATNVHNLHGRYELSKEGYEELRGLVKEAMECLKPTPQTPSYAYSDGPGVIHNHGTVITGAAEELGKMMEMYQSAGYMARPEYQLESTADGRVLIGGGCPFPSGHVHTADLVAREPMWKGYRQADIIAACHTSYGASHGLYAFVNDEIASPFGGTVFWPTSQITLRREAGLRRPDESDYRKLG